jgi:hypothetical protein
VRISVGSFKKHTSGLLATDAAYIAPRCFVSSLYPSGIWQLCQQLMLE